MKSRPYGSWTRQESESTDDRRSTPRASGQAHGRTRERPPGRERRRTGGRAPSGGPRYDRMILVFVGVALVLLSVGLVFADVRKAGDAAVSTAPKDQDMTLTVPSMKRVKEVPVYGGPIPDETALHNGTLHVGDTGFPWQDGSNVYIAGHRLGYPRTDSFLVFWDLNKLKRGQRVLLTDSEDTKYVYKVFDRHVVGPDEVSIKKPIEGKNIVSLQTCTLPDYKERLVVQAELVRTVRAPAKQAPTEQASGEGL